jgi:hypothetical protein
VGRRRGRIRKQLLDHLKETRGYGELKYETLDRIPWKNRFVRGHGPVVRQTTEWMRLQQKYLLDMQCVYVSKIRLPVVYVFAKVTAFETFEMK